MDPQIEEIDSVYEALISISVVKTQLTRLKTTLSSLVLGKAPEAKSIRNTADGQIIVSVFPFETADKYGPQGAWTAELWLEPNQKATQCKHLMTSNNTDTNTNNKCTIVLGAGNQGFLTIVDALDILFIQNETVCVKHHPLRGYQDGFMREIFKPLLERGFFNCVVDTTVADAVLLVNHTLVGHVHMTGGKPTHDAIYWGVGAEAKDRKERNAPKLAARMTSELGCITPWIVVPAIFTEKELLHQASHLAAAMNANGSCNCNSPKAIVMSEGWKQKERFVQEVQKALCEMQVTPPYYPGETKRYNQFQAAYPTANSLVSNKDVIPKVRAKGSRDVKDLPFLVIDIEMAADGTCENNYALQNEAFCPVVIFVTVKDLNDTPTFINKVPDIVNDKIFGTLSCTVILHPEMEKKYFKECQTLLANLKYGTICINAWSALAYAIDTSAWGAYPGEDPKDIESGIGFVRNTLMFDHVQKSVVRCPLVDQGQVLHYKVKPFDKKEHVEKVVKFILRPGLGTFVGILPSWSKVMCGVFGILVLSAIVVGVVVGQG